ncbi:MAG TPA: hypothetical protein PL094_04840, partial [Acinetobacter johnsonii]|nr:hypothetical protein [Acinetobacter johnsonii]
ELFKSLFGDTFSASIVDRHSRIEVIFLLLLLTCEKEQNSSSSKACMIILHWEDELFLNFGNLQAELRSN